MHPETTLSPLSAARQIIRGRRRPRDRSKSVEMISLDKALLDLVKRNLIATEEAVAKANHPETIRGGPPISAAA